MENELISVVLPVWKPNIEQLKECLDSLIKQTYSKIEIIICYRESLQYNKEFFDTVNEYHDSRIRVIIENGGFQMQLNEGILNSKGEYIARIDGDDFCEINRFEKQLEYIKKYNYDILGSWAHYISNEGKQIRDLKLPVTHKEIRKKIVFFDPILHPSVLINKKIIRELGNYDTRFIHAEDYELWLRAIFKGFRCGNIPEYLVSIRHNPESLTRGKTWKIAKMYSLKAKKKAIFQYGFNQPLDVFYYLVSLMFVPISPQMTIRINKILRRHKK
jgi:glycosyltransferase involved in cell wall biosynthesis